VSTVRITVKQVMSYFNAKGTVCISALTVTT